MKVTIQQWATDNDDKMLPHDKCRVMISCIVMDQWQLKMGQFVNISTFGIKLGLMMNIDIELTGHWTRLL